MSICIIAPSYIDSDERMKFATDSFDSLKNATELSIPNFLLMMNHLLIGRATFNLYIQERISKFFMALIKLEVPPLCCEWQNTL